MGYNTIFHGELKFNRELSGSELTYLKSFFGEDSRDHPEWGEGLEWYYLDLILNDNFSGIRWNDGTEKSRGLELQVEFLQKRMNEKCPPFYFEGEMNAQGEDADDRWVLLAKDGVIKKIMTPPAGVKTKCPECGYEFYLDDKKGDQQ